MWWYLCAAAIALLVLLLIVGRPRTLAGFRGPPQVPLLYNGLQAMWHFQDPLAWMMEATNRYGLTWAGRIPPHPMTIITSDPVYAAVLHLFVVARL